MIKLLYFSGYKWGNMGRRKVRLAYEFSRQPEVASLLYVEPPVATSLLDLARGRFEPGHLGQNRRTHLRALLGRPRLNVKDTKVWVYTGSQKSIPLTRVPALRRLGVLQRLNQALYVRGIRRLLKRLPGDELVLWLSYPLQAWALDAFPQRMLACYDWTDDWAAFDILPVQDSSEIVALNDRVLRQVDLVFAVSAELERRAAAVNPRTYRAPNATDPEKLGQAASPGPVAAELAGLPRPIIGYVGQVADKVDYELIDQVARARPEWSFVFVGPIWYSKQERVAALEALGNVHFWGARPFDQLVPYLRGFDVCTLPHAITPLTRSMDPIKLYDYLATGKPIVSTPVAGVERFADVVYVGDTIRGFLDALDRAVQENGTQCERRLYYACQNTWPQRAAEMWKAVIGRMKSAAC
ncbi:MAG: glycosyltransferase [Anaerolineae bacterium]|nr:glycosyltransferase [Anaerolineae bacterium]